MKTDEREQVLEKRIEKRQVTEQYFSVEFTVRPMGSPYQCRIRDLSTTGLCILVPGNSVILEHLKVGAVLEMTYHPKKPPGSRERLETEIRHITAVTEGPFKGQVLIGLKILESDAFSAVETI